ncbi:MAG: erythromycin esterase family protein [Bdellovibrio sp.]|nr:erythromycin esterase family protein [Bdellovibrio sp.]
MTHFENRKDAGRALGERLLAYKDQDPLILAIPRGGVPVAFEVAKRLQAPLDLLMVKKVGHPLNPELAVGAVTESGPPWFNLDLIRRLQLSMEELEDAAKAKLQEVSKQMEKFRFGQAPPSVNDRVVILIDDGIATGATILAAVQLLRERNPLKIIVATPVASVSSLEQIRKAADDLVCLLTPENFYAVGNWYQDFDQVSDKEVIEILKNRGSLLGAREKELNIRDEGVELKGDLTLIENMRGLIVFAHGSGSSRQSPRNRFVAKELNKMGFSTLLSDLLTDKEAADRKNVFDVELLIRRLLKSTEAGLRHLPDHKTPIGFFGANTGAAAALGAAAKSERDIFAVVSRGGRPDLAEKYFEKVRVPTLLIVGGNDKTVILSNEEAARRLPSAKMVTVPKATHLFEEPGALEEVVEYATDWFLENSPSSRKVSEPKENVVREIEMFAHPIKREDSWDDLVERLSKSRIVMLGEATHGTAEFYSVRRMISQRLIRDYGFDFIAVEGDWPSCQKFNDYIHHGKGRSAREIMRQFERWPTWMWANDETALLIEWMKEFKSHFYGLDVYSLFESMDYVQAYAEKMDHEFAQEVKNNYACFDPFARDEKAYAKYLVKFTEGCRSEVVENLRKILRVRLEDIKGVSEDLFSAQQNARIVKNAEDYYRSMLFGGPESWNVRDQHMMDTLEILLHRHSKNSKCIVWAHNSHIGDYHATDMLEEGYVNLGGLAREKFGVDQVALVGFGTYQGEVLAGPAWDGPETHTPLPPAREASFEFFCHKASEDLKSPRFYMLFDAEARKTILGSREFGHRAVGVVYRPQFEEHGRNYVPTQVAQRYDAFVFIDKTTALRSVPTVISEKDFPETWPGGI